MKQSILKNDIALLHGIPPLNPSSLKQAYSVNPLAEPHFMGIGRYLLVQRMPAELVTIPQTEVVKVEPHQSG